MAKRCTRNINDNPLRKLRILIGTEEKPIPQHELASLTGISVNTIRGIEGGHRDAGRSTLKKIEVMTGMTFIRSYGLDPDGVEVTKYRKRMAEKYAELTKTVRPVWWQESTPSPWN